MVESGDKEPSILFTKKQKDFQNDYFQERNKQ